MPPEDSALLVTETELMHQGLAPLKCGGVWGYGLVCFDLFACFAVLFDFVFIVWSFIYFLPVMFGHAPYL